MLIDFNAINSHIVSSFQASIMENAAPVASIICEGSAQEHKSFSALQDNNQGIATIAMKFKRHL
jgi:hypothetical protein